MTDAARRIRHGPAVDEFVQVLGIWLQRLDGEPPRTRAV
jgi:hypothetical protein